VREAASPHELPDVPLSGPGGGSGSLGGLAPIVFGALAKPWGLRMLLCIPHLVGGAIGWRATGRQTRLFLL
jgi:hypothetical protein